MERPDNAAATQERTRASEPPAHGGTDAFIVEPLREILARRVPAGSRLIDRDLMARFLVSRGRVREALRRLAADGLIDHVPNRGALVRRLTTGDSRTV